MKHIATIAALLGARAHELRGKHTVAGCRHSVLRHLEAAGNAADPGWATLCCAARHLPAALPSAENPPAAAFERILCAAPKAAPPAALEDLTLGKFFFYAATHPKYAGARGYNYTGWKFLPQTCGEAGWFRPACGGAGTGRSPRASAGASTR